MEHLEASTEEPTFVSIFRLIFELQLYGNKMQRKKHESAVLTAIDMEEILL